MKINYCQDDLTNISANEIPLSTCMQMQVGHALGRKAAMQLLMPLVRVLCERLLGILQRMPSLACVEHNLRSSATIAAYGMSCTPYHLTSTCAFKIK